MKPDKITREVRYQTTSGCHGHFGTVRELGYSHPKGNYQWGLFYGAAWLATGYAKTERGALRCMNKDARSRGLEIAPHAPRQIGY